MRLSAQCLHRSARLCAGTVLLGLCTIVPWPAAAAQAASPAATHTAAPAPVPQGTGTANAAPTAADGGMEFSDKPAYSVAGVTDWTAVGGHGSDSTLRTSEELNREALALKAKAGTGSGNPAALGHRQAGDIAEQQGNPLLAVREYGQAAELDPSEPNYLALGTELLLHRAVWQAVNVFAKAAAAYPKSATLLTAQGAALFAGGRYDEAATAICRAAALDPAAREPYHFAGEIAAAAPATDPCLGAILHRALADRPQDAQLNFFAAMYALKLHTAPDRERARQLLLKAVALDPKGGAAPLQLGILSASARDYPAAIAYYRKALAVDPGLSEAHYRLGVALDRTGQSSEAAAEYKVHADLDARDAARVEAERREVKQFSGAMQAAPAAASAQ